jgi:heterodisulfide reductase subunit D
VQQLAEAVKQAKAWACYDCGKCTATCPIARVGGLHSPRRQVLASNLAGSPARADVARDGVLGQERESVEDATLFHCLTCALCDARCPAQVGYTGLVQKLREIAYDEGAEPDCPHGGALQSVMRMMARGDTRQNRLEWLNPPHQAKSGPDGDPGGGLKTQPEKGEVFYWTGCTMYFDALFPDLPVKTLNGTRAAVRLLNRMGIEPVVSGSERCCGHDLLWNGDRRNFELLAQHNTRLVAESGAKVLVSSCAECVRTWKLDYEPFFPGKPPRVVHLTEFLAEHAAELKPKANGRMRVTYQDPCRLCRHLDICDPPRQVLKSLPGVEFVEMRHSGAAAVCCAGGTWSHCDRFAKKIQVERLREARATGAEVIAAACPKCQIHLACAMKDPHLGSEIGMALRDIAELVDAATGGPPLQSQGPTQPRQREGNP